MCKVDLTWSSNQTDVTEAELFELATNQFDELLERFYIRFFREDVSISFSGIESYTYEPYWIQPFSCWLLDCKYTTCDWCAVLMHTNCNKVETYFSEGLYPHKDKMNIKTFFHLPGSKLSGKRHCSATFGQTGCVTLLSSNSETGLIKTFRMIFRKLLSQPSLQFVRIRVALQPHVYE